MTTTEERLKQADHTINELNRALRNAAVWGGMDWHCNPLHPIYVHKCLDLIKAYHAGKLQTAIEVFSKPSPNMIESKVTTTFTTDLCAEIDRLESQLNNITCIVAEAKSNLKELGGYANELTAPVSTLISNLEFALEMKEIK